MRAVPGIRLDSVPHAGVIDRAGRIHFSMEAFVWNVSTHVGGDALKSWAVAV